MAIGCYRCLDPFGPCPGGNRGTAICLTPLQEVLDIVAACGAAQPTVAAERVAKDGRFRVTQRIVPRVEVQMVLCLVGKRNW